MWKNYDEETQKRREFIIEVIKSRDETYKYVPEPEPEPEEPEPKSPEEAKKKYEELLDEIKSGLKETKS